MMTREQFMNRPEDMKLNPTFAAMRVAQRERDWPHYWMNCQMAQSTTRSIGVFYEPTQNILDGILGKGFSGEGQ